MSDQKKGPDHAPKKAPSIKGFEGARGPKPKPIRINEGLEEARSDYDPARGTKKGGKGKPSGSKK